MAELVVTVGVLVLVVFLATQLLKSATTVTTQGHKQMDADAQTRQLLDRMAIDFAQMVKRSDVDYYLKSSWFASGSPPGPAGVRYLPFSGNDKIAFYSTVPGYPSTGSQSPVSLVAYQVNSNSNRTNPSYNKLERMGKGLAWNAVTLYPGPAPVVFMPIPLASPIPTPELPYPAPFPLPTPAWPEINTPNGSWSDSEVAGPQVFRFEYYYLLKGQADPINSGTTYTPIFSDTPWDTRICSCPSPTPTPIPSATPTATPIPIATPTPPSLCCHVAPEGMQDVAAIVVVIAVIDPQSKALLDSVDPTGAKLKRLNGNDGSPAALIDWGDTTCVGCTQTQWQTTPGLLRAQWRGAIDANSVGLPQPVISGIRVYERYLYLSPPTLLTP